VRVLVSGATGYIGRQLVPILLASGHQVSSMVRNASRPLPEGLRASRVVQADALQPDTLAAALQDIDVAYYLIHSMSGSVEGFEERDRRAAQNFATAARDAGVSRIVYLGGLASGTKALSAHLKSRQETGEFLRRYGPPVLEFRAGIIVGNGSTSFEIIRTLTERLPVMVCPQWVVTRTQPIAVSDVLQYLVSALQLPAGGSEVIEIGGSVESYRSMMLEFARHRGLRRWLIQVPVLTPRLSSYWLDLVTAVPPAVSRPLIEGLRTETVCSSGRAQELFPNIQPVNYAQAVGLALRRDCPPQQMLENLDVRTAHQKIRSEGLICDVRQVEISASAERVFSVLARLGGSHGWFYANFLWRMRGRMDQLLGGPGLSRGRPAHDRLQEEDVIDCWRVQESTRGKRLLLRSELKLPGRAWLQFDVFAQSPDASRLRCCAWYEPRGVAGELYWWLLYPVHLDIFRGMVRRIGREAERQAGTAVARAS
jgi:uncharacterized protein YbjT (DUF2867 family)